MQWLFLTMLIIAAILVSWEYSSRPIQKPEIENDAEPSTELRKPPPVPAQGTLIIDTVPSEARIVLDDVDRGPSRDGTLRIENIAAGRYSVEVSKPGYHSQSLEGLVKAGETQRLHARLRPIVKSTFLVAVTGPTGGEPDPGLDSAVTTLVGRLTRSGYSVIDQGQTARILQSEAVMETLRGADSVRIAAIAQQHGAEVIIVGRLKSEAPPALKYFFSGKAVFELRCVHASTGQYLAAETLRVGDAKELGKPGRSELMARTEASKAVAEMAAEKVIELVVPQLKEASRLAADDVGTATAGHQRLIIVAFGATLGEARELRTLLDGQPRVAELRQTSFVNGKRQELSLLYEGEARELGEALDGAEIGTRRLGLDQAQPGRLTFRLQGPLAVVLAVAPPAESVAPSPPGASKEPDAKIVVAVLPLGLTEQTAQRYPQLAERSVGFGIHSMLVERLYETGRFRVVEEKQGVIDDLLYRQWISGGGFVSKESAVSYGNLTGAHHVVYGEVYDFSSQRVARKLIETRIALQVRIVDVETSEYVPASGSGVETRKGKVFVRADLVDFARSTVGLATDAALDEAVSKLLRRFSGES